MDVQYINPFLESVYDFFQTMLNSTAKLDKVRKADEKIPACALISIIGLSGPVNGTVALLFPRDTALKLVERFIGMETPEVDETVIDAIAEVVNIVAGGAKARLQQTDELVSLSLPNVIAGEGTSVLSPSWTQWIEVGFSSDLGSFQLRVTLEKKG